jgi:hypothetical protein
MTGQLITFPVRLYVRGARLLLHAAEDVTGKAVMGTLRVAGALANLRPGANDDGGWAPAAPPAPAEPEAVTATPRNGSSPASPPRSRPAPRRSTTQRSRPERHSPSPAPAPVGDLPEPDPRIARRAEQDVAPAPPAPTGGQEESSDAPQPLASDRLEQDGLATHIDLDAPAPAAPDHVSADAVLVREEAEAGAEEGAGASITIQEPWDGYGQLHARDVVGRLAAATTAELAAVQLYEAAHRKRQTVIAAVQRELAKPQR